MELRNLIFEFVAEKFEAELPPLPADVFAPILQPPTALFIEWCFPIAHVHQDAVAIASLVALSLNHSPVFQVLQWPVLLVSADACLRLQETILGDPYLQLPEGQGFDEKLQHQLKMELFKIPSKEGSDELEQCFHPNRQFEVLLGMPHQHVVDALLPMRTLLLIFVAVGDKVVAHRHGLTTALAACGALAQRGRFYFQTACSSSSLDKYASKLSRTMRR